MPASGRPLQGVVLDMAGTTLQAGDLVPAVFAEVFAAEGLVLSPEEIRAVRGRSKREAITSLLDRHDVVTKVQADSLYDAFQATLAERYRRQGVSPVEGAEQTLVWLAEHDIGVALTTGFDRELAHLLLELVGWRELADTVVCNEDVPRGRPAPYLIFRALERLDVDAVACAAVVGDTVSDLLAAENAGVERSIGVLSGAHDEQQLRATPHWRIIPSVKDLPALLAPLLAPVGEDEPLGAGG